MEVNPTYVIEILGTQIAKLTVENAKLKAYVIELERNQKEVTKYGNNDTSSN